MSEPASYNAVTNRTVYTEPALTGALDLSGNHAAGRGVNYRFQDPTFGNYLIRVTDDKTETVGVGDNRVFTVSGSAENIEWNTDSTLFFVKGQGGEQIFYNFDALTHTLTRVGDVTSTSGGIWLLDHTIGNFSLSNSKIFWSTYGYTIRKYDFTSVNSASTAIPFTTTVDFGSIYTSLLGVAPNVSYSGSDISVDATDTWACMALGGDGPQDTWRLCIAYNINTGAYFALDNKYGSSGVTRVYSSATSTWTNTSMYGQWGIHNVKMDRSGTYVGLSNDGTRPAGDSNQYIWTFIGTTISSPQYSDFAGGHKVFGYGSMINETSELPVVNTPSWFKRPLNNLANETELILPRLNTTATDYYDDHASWANVDATETQPVFIATMRETEASGPFPWRVWDREILAVAMDGATVYRFAHHHDHATGSFRVFGNVSQDGRFVLFASNWGQTLGSGPRDDVFLVELPVPGSVITSNVRLFMQVA